MKTRVILLAASVTLGMAIAQTAPDQQPPTPPQTTPAQSKTSDAKTDTKAPDTTAATKPAEMQTKTYKGVLVDMSCASREAKASVAKPDDAKSDDANSANRAAGDSAAASCNVSASSSELGLKMKDGHTVRFDLVGNQRAQDGLKNNKHWTKDMGAGKEIHATVLGALNGDKLIVSSID